MRDILVDNADYLNSIQVNTSIFLSRCILLTKVVNYAALPPSLLFECDASMIISLLNGSLHWSFMIFSMDSAFIYFKCSREMIVVNVKLFRNHVTTNLLFICMFPGSI